MPLTKNTSPLLFAAVAFAVLFRHGEVGANVFLFDAILLTLALWHRPDLGQHRAFIWAVAGLLFSAVSIIIVHGPLSTLAHGISAVLVLGFAQARELRFIWFGALLGLLSAFQSPRRWRQLRPEHACSDAHPDPRRLFHWLRQAAVPLLIALPFLALYLLSSERFGSVFTFLSRFKVGSEIWWTCFTFLLRVCLGALLVTPLFLPAQKPSQLVAIARSFRDQLQRRSAETSHRAFSSPVALKDEYRRGVMTFILLNLLLLVVNATDLRYVWMTTDTLSAATLSQYVHAGTYSLIISILLAMAVVVHYFRGNLNFYAQGAWLAPLAKLWIAQNALLALSVGWRNFHYIREYGLATGRIYVVFVLLLLLFGLRTLFRKVKLQLSLTYLLQANGLSLWLAILLFGAVNWPGLITRYNLSVASRSKLDLDYLLHDVSRDNTFLLLQSGKVKRDELPYHKQRKGIFAPRSWRSWNYADWRNFRALAAPETNIRGNEQKTLGAGIQSPDYCTMSTSATTGR